MDDPVEALRAAVGRGDRAAARGALHPYLHWTDAAGATTRGRTNVLALLADARELAAPRRVELRDGQVYRWEAGT